MLLQIEMVVPSSERFHVLSSCINTISPGISPQLVWLKQSSLWYRSEYVLFVQQVVAVYWNGLTIVSYLLGFGSSYMEKSLSWLRHSFGLVEPFRCVVVLWIKYILMLWRLCIVYWDGWTILWWVVTVYLGASNVTYVFGLQRDMVEPYLICWYDVHVFNVLNTFSREHVVLSDSFNNILLDIFSSSTDRNDLWFNHTSVVPIMFMHLMCWRHFEEDMSCSMKRWITFCLTYFPQLRIFPDLFMV